MQKNVRDFPRFNFLVGSESGNKTPPSVASGFFALQLGEAKSSSVPDHTSTFALLGMALTGLAAGRFRPVRFQ